MRDVMQNLSSRGPGAWRWCMVGVVLLGVLMIAARTQGPSDLDSKDQPKTVSYTVDMAENGRYLLPKDVRGQWATKPPFYNWVSLPVVGGLGIHEDWSFKLPSIVTFLGLLGLTAGAVVCVLSPTWWGRDRVGAAAVIACLIWVSLPPVMSLAYVARPDMLLAFFLVVGWLAVTRCLQDPARPWFWPVVVWVSVALAWLTKGPPALLVPVYAVVAAPFVGGRWGSVWRTGIVWGLPLSVVPFVGWVWGSYVIAPDYMSQTMLGNELSRVQGQGGVLAYPLGLILTSWELPFFFLFRALPWSWLFVALWLSRNKIVRHRMSCLTPAWVWCLVVVGFMSLVVSKRDDYLLPMYPAMAALMGVGLVSHPWARGWAGLKRVLWAAVAATVVVMGIVVGNEVLLNPERQVGWAENARSFARAIEGEVGDERVLFERSGYHPLQTYMGLNQSTESPVDGAWDDAAWVVAPLVLVGDREPVLVSKELPNVLRERQAVGLFRRESGLAWPPVWAEVTAEE
ncbi:MAG: hypothetical protein RLN76_00210 [Phycisphaeraceae bacterium]